MNELQKKMIAAVCLHNGIPHISKLIAESCERVSVEFAIGFAEWMEEKCFRWSHGISRWTGHEPLKSYTTSELISLYIESLTPIR